MDKQTLIIVSGLRRTGTSLMMQLLNEAGIKPNTDNKKKADQFNPNGYFEHSEMSKLLVDDSFLDSSVDKCTKIYAAKLHLLPKRFNYKIIFMERDVSEVYISLKKTNNQKLKVYAATHLNFLQGVVEKAIGVIESSDNMEMISVNFNSLINDPDMSLKSISEFLDLTPNFINNAKQVIDPKLYTSRKSSEILTIDRCPAEIVPFIEEHVKNKIFCEIGIGEGDNLAGVKNAQAAFGVEVSNYGVARCAKKYPNLKVIHASILDVLDDVEFDVCFMWLVYPLNKDVVLEVIKKKPEAKILMGINYYFHLDESDEKYQAYLNAYRDVASANTWNQNTRNLIKEVNGLGYSSEIVEIKSKSNEIFSVAIIEKK